MDTPCLTYQNSGVQPAWAPEEAKTMPVLLPGGIDYAAGTVLGAVTGAQANDVQTVTITGTPTGGTIRLLLNGELTSAIAYNASAADVQTALEALDSVGSGNVACTGGAFPGSAVVCTFQGDLAARPIPLMTALNSLTGGTTPAVSVAHTTPGTYGPGQFAAYDDSASDGTQTAVCILKRRVQTNLKGEVLLDSGVTSLQRSSSAYYQGAFYTADLTGLDANGVADLGRLLVGTTSTLSATTTVLKLK